MSSPTIHVTGNGAADDRYRWTALSNTTLGMFMATLDTLDRAHLAAGDLPRHPPRPLDPRNISYLLWMLMGYLVVTAVLVVTFGRLGDMFGRVRMYNAGFAVFTVRLDRPVASRPVTARGGAIWLIVWRVVQGIGGALLMANSTAILTDAFPAEQRGMAMGINMVAGIAGSFIGLVVGGLLADVDWRLVFWVNVPFGLFGTVWAYAKLREVGTQARGQHRLVGQRHLRRRADPDPRRHHLRHPALRRPHHGLDEPVRAGRAHRRRRCCWSPSL